MKTRINSVIRKLIEFSEKHNEGHVHTDVWEAVHLIRYLNAKLQVATSKEQ